MNMPSPPGWYPDPHDPAAQRWWDGSAWTGHARPAAAPGGFGPPPVADGGNGEPSRRAKAIALAAAGVVLVASLVTGVFVLGRGGETPPETIGGSPEATQTPTSPPSESTAEPAPSASAEADPDTLVDQLNGIALPIPYGWQRSVRAVDKAPTMTTADTYDCPGTPGFCHRGTVSSHTVDSDAGDTPRQVARHDITGAAESAYDRDTAGRRPFNGMTSHRELAEGPVQVAGRQGYFVRWSVTTESGPGGYVQSVAFRSPTAAGQLLVVRFALDKGQEARPTEVIGEILRGIRSTDGADS